MGYRRTVDCNANSQQAAIHERAMIVDANCHNTALAKMGVLAYSYSMRQGGFVDPKETASFPLRGDQ